MAKQRSTLQSVGNAIDKASENTEEFDGYTWSYAVKDGEARIEAKDARFGTKVIGVYCCAVSPNPTGCIEIPASLGGLRVTCIELNAFWGCTNLTSVSIPASVTQIKPGAFHGRSSLMKFSVDPNNPSYSARNGMLCSKDGTILVAGVNGDVVIPSGVTHIGGAAFVGCSNLTSVTLPESVTSIGSDSFLGMPFAKTPFYENMPDGLVILGGGVLCGYKGRCPSSVTIPSSVKSIGGEAFYDCGGLMSITMCGERPDAPSNVFKGCRKLKSIHVPANAKSWAGMKEWQGIPLVFDAK